jgi:hypothetical protein
MEQTWRLGRGASASSLRTPRVKSPYLLLIALILLIPWAGAVGEGDPLEAARAEVLNEYFGDALVRRMHIDAAPVIERFGGINVFTTAQFGNSFLVGTVDGGEIFDARNRDNMRIFKAYAKERLLILNLSEREGYCRYALAATRFLREMGYDAVLFNPDEYHPVFTRADDTWMFIREDPVRAAGSSIFYSAQVKDRRVEVEGGLSMEALSPPSLSIFYVPSPGTEYGPYRIVETEPVKGSSSPHLLNPYRRGKASEEMLKKRAHLGIVPCPFSFRENIPVGAWVKPGALEEKWKIGMRFSGSDRAYTWGACGIYVVPLDRDLWKR